MGAYRAQSADTSEAAERFWIGRLREVPPWRKVEMVSGLCRMADTFAEAGLRERHPGVSEEELFLRLAAMRLPPDFLERVWRIPSDLPRP